MSYLLDNFSTSEKSCLGSSWVANNDQAMGGSSQLELSHQQVENQTFLRLQGQVNHNPPAGYIEASLPLIRSRHLFDASDFEGVFLCAKSKTSFENFEGEVPERFFIRLQTRELSMPWQYYQAAFSPRDQWETFQIPFQRFRAIRTSHALNPERLTAIAVAAAEHDFEVDLELTEIGFY